MTSRNTESNESCRSAGMSVKSRVADHASVGALARLLAPTAPAQSGVGSHASRVRLFLSVKLSLSHGFIRCHVQEAVSMGDATTFAVQHAQGTLAIRTVLSCCHVDTPVLESVGNPAQISVLLATRRIQHLKCSLVQRTKRMPDLSSLSTAATCFMLSLSTLGSKRLQKRM